MEYQKKTIQELAVSLDTRREDLIQAYRQFGSRLLNESLNPAGASGEVSQEKSDTWRSLMVTRERDTQAVLSIKNSVERQHELKKLFREIEKARTEELLRGKEAYVALGHAFFNFYDNRNDEIFRQVFAQAENEELILRQLEEEQQRLRKEYEQANFFSKMVVHLKLSGMSGSVRQNREKVDKLLHDGVKSLLLDPVITQKMADGAFDSSIQNQYEACKESDRCVMDLNDREEALKAEAETIHANLEVLGAAVHYQKRLDSLQSSIRETDKRLDSLAILVGREYADRFFEDNGNAVDTGPDTGVTFQSYASQLTTIRDLRKEITVIRRSIEILETSVQIDSLNKNISGWENSCEDYKKRIERYTEMIETMRRNIAEATKEREILVEHREKLEKESL